jgi:predicted permease
VSRRPPALGRWLLRRLLPAGIIAEGIAGDLEQEYAARPRPIWYLRAVIGIILLSLRDRLRGRSWFAPTAPRAGRGPAASGSDAGSPNPRRAPLEEALLQDLRFALRTLAQRPLFTAVAVATLALGMGVNLAIFSVINGLLLRPVPLIEHPETLVEIARGRASEYEDVSFPALRMVRDSTVTLTDVAGWDGIELSYRDPGAGEAVVISGREVTGSYFSVLGVEPAVGRLFGPDSFWPDVEAEVVITDHLWQERYGGADDVVGRTVLINGVPATIIGVTPEGFAGHQVLVQRDVFVPIGMAAPGMMSARELESPTAGYMVLIGRLARGTGIDAARQELATLGERFSTDNGIDGPYAFRIDPYAGIPVTDRSTVALFFAMLLLISAVVMAIACVNVANMLLARGLERRRELAIRMSLGAGRGRVVRQLLTESTLLFLAAVAAALLVSGWVTDLLVRLYLPQTLTTRLLLDVSPDWRVLGFASLLTALTALVFGLAPALSASRAAGRTIRSRSARLPTPRLSSFLVGAQMALSLLLLVAAGLMGRTLAALESADLGFDVDGIYLVKLDVEHVGYDLDRTRAFYTELLDEVRAVPGVAAAATSRKPPLATASTIRGIFPDGVEPPRPEGFSAHFNRVSTEYFRTAGIPLLRGREFEPSDTADAPRVAIINATMAERIWGAGEALGRRFTLGSGSAARRYQVVGIAADAHYHSFVEKTPDFLYLAAAQSPDTTGHVMVRGHMASTLDAVRARVSRVDADVPIAEIMTVREEVDGFAMAQQLAAWFAGAVGAVGLLLGAVGVYGVTAFAVGRRTHEIGVRMALGACASDVRHLLLRRGLRAPLLGMIVGLALAAGAARLLESLLYGVSASDPLTFVVVSAVLGGVALLATLLPAHRAARLDPSRTLRAE